jgi:hypothetical protein
MSSLRTKLITTPCGQKDFSYHQNQQIETATTCTWSELVLSVKQTGNFYSRSMYASLPCAQNVQIAQCGGCIAHDCLGYHNLRRERPEDVNVWSGMIQLFLGDVATYI